MSYSGNHSNPLYPTYTAGGCTVTVAYSVVTCFAAPGMGGALAAVITIGGQSSAPSSPGLRYMTPVVSGLSGLGAVNAPTTGGTQIVLSGNFFGPLTPLGSGGLPVAGPESIGITLPLATYTRAGPATTSFPVIQALGCFVSVADVQVRCACEPLWRRLCRSHIPRY